MGHVLTPHDVKIDPEKAKAVQDMPKPEDVEGIQRIDGFVNYLAKFLPGSCRCNGAPAATDQKRR